MEIQSKIYEISAKDLQICKKWGQDREKNEIS